MKITRKKNKNRKRIIDLTTRDVFVRDNGEVCMLAKYPPHNRFLLRIINLETGDYVEVDYSFDGNNPIHNEIVTHVKGELVITDFSEYKEAEEN
jgi:hypothetical protein